MSRFLYWTIVLGTEPTSFRAAEADELLPTLTQLRRKHPDASLRWFQRGRLWVSPDEAKAALARERSETRGRPATWRPGGKHEDPRQKYVDAKKAKWTRFKSAIRERAEARREPRERDERVRVERPGAERPPVIAPPIETPPDERSAPTPVADVPAERPQRRDWRTRTEPGDAPRLIRKPVVRRPQPVEADPPVAREGRPPFDRDRKPPFDRDRKPAFDRDRKPPFDRDRKPAFDRDRKPPFDRDRKPACEGERHPPIARVRVA